MNLALHTIIYSSAAVIMSLSLALIH